MFKHAYSGLIYNNRKEAVRIMGQARYRKALEKGEFEFGYELKDGERSIKSKWS